MGSFFSEKLGQIQQWLHKTAIQSVKKKSRPKEYNCSILCIDDDTDFCTYLERLAAPLLIRLDKVSSIEEAKQKIEEKSDYKAYIIDGHLPDGSGFELIAWMREKKGLDAPLAFLSRIYQDAASFRILKESLKVDYVLDKPLRPDEVEHLFNRLCLLTNYSKAVEEPFPDELLDELKQVYEKSIFDKLERIEKLIINLQNDPTVENIQDLKSEVHKIAGSSGSYGYPKVSKLCKDLELNLIQQIERSKEIPSDDKWLASLDDFFTKLKMCFQVFHTAPPKAIKPSLSANLQNQPSLYVIDNDQEFLDFLKDQKENLAGESDPKEAFLKLSSPNFITPFILTRAHFPASELTGFDLIRTYYQNEEEIYPTAAIISEVNNLDEQIETIKRAVFFIFLKPFSLHSMMPLLEQRPLTTSSEFRILVIDDDPDSSQYIEQALKGMNMTVRVFERMNQLEKAIDETNPHLILLDLDTSNGTFEETLDFLKKMQFNCPVLGMVTVSPKEKFIEKIYESNVDDILFKPLEGITFKRRIFGLYKKFLKEHGQIDKSNVSGLWDPSSFYDQAILDRMNAVLVVFEIEKFSHLEKAFGKKVENEVLSIIRSSLYDLIRRYDYASYLDLGRFGLIFNRLDVNYIRLLLEDFFIRTEKLILDKILVETEVELVGAIIPLIEKDISIEEIKKQIDHTLKTKKKDKITISESGRPSEKSALIISDSMADVLKKELSSLGFQSIVLKNEKDLPENIPSLIVLEGMSVANRAALLLKKISAKNIQMPVVYFSELTSLEPLVNLIRSEGLKYSENPFHLMAVIEGIREKIRDEG